MPEGLGVDKKNIFFAKIVVFLKIALTFAVPLYRGIEQLVARRAHNPEVTGSSPVPATF